MAPIASKPIVFLRSMFLPSELIDQKLSENCNLKPY